MSIELKPGAVLPKDMGSREWARWCRQAGIVETQAANPDTSGATLGQLETEVNQLKAVLRTFGLIAP